MSHLDEGTIHALLDGELTPAERAEAEAHLSTCAECRVLWEEAQLFARESDALLGAVVPPPRTARPAAGVQPATRRRMNPLYRNLAWAASLVLAVGLGYWASDLRYTRLADAPPGNAAARLASEATVSESAQAKSDTQTADQVAQSPVASQRDRQDRAAAPPQASEARQAQAPAAAEPAAPGEPTPAARNALQPRDKVEETPGALEAARIAGQAVTREADAAKLAQGRRSEARPVPAPPAGGLSAADETATFRPITLEQAVSLMGGKLRMIGGLTPLRVMSGPGSLSPLAEPSAVVVRLVYPDAPGREVWLDQMRPVELESGPVAAARRAPPGSLIPGDTLLSGDGAGRRSVRWLDGQGGRLALTGMLPGDSLRALARRVY